MDAGRDAAPSADSAVAHLDLGVDAFVCMPLDPPDNASESDEACTIPFNDADCDGEPDFDPICPICPHATDLEVEGTPCSVPGLACEYSGPGFCNFWGCDCGDDDGDGMLEWACWWPLC